jgi:hypothetical protein
VLYYKAEYIKKGSVKIKCLITNFFHTISGWGYPLTLHFSVTAEPFSIETDPLGCMLFIDAGAVIQHS